MPDFTTAQFSAQKLNELPENAYFASVIDRDLTIPPGAPSDHDAYIIAAGATGDWSGHDGEYTEWIADDAEWIFITPPTDGFPLWVEDEQLFVVRKSGAWSTDLTSLYIKADGTRAFSGDQSMGGNIINSMGTCASGSEAANKSYVDATAQSARTDGINAAQSALTGDPLTIKYSGIANSIVILSGFTVNNSETAQFFRDGLYAIKDDHFSFTTVSRIHFGSAVTATEKLVATKMLT